MPPDRHPSNSSKLEPVTLHLGLCLCSVIINRKVVSFGGLCSSFLLEVGLFSKFYN